MVALPDVVSIGSYRNLSILYGRERTVRVMCLSESKGNVSKSNVSIQRPQQTLRLKHNALTLSVFSTYFKVVS